MSSYSYDELVYELEAKDPSALLLIVEGVGDVRFLSRLVPYALRRHATVMAVEEVEAPQGIGNSKRERSLWLASQLIGNPHLSERVKFLVDSDLDRFLAQQSTTPDNVLVTDYSDFESYVLNECSLSHIMYVFGKEPERHVELEKCILRICRPIKEIRVASAKTGLNLPINNTLGGENRDRLKRYLADRELAISIDAQRLLAAVSNNASLASLERLTCQSEIEQLQSLCIPERHWVQGKDLIAALSAIFKISYAEAKRIALSAMLACTNSLRGMPSLAAVDAFLKS